MKMICEFAGVRTSSFGFAMALYFLRVWKTWEDRPHSLEVREKLRPSLATALRRVLGKTLNSSKKNFQEEIRE
jgi:hypothetical protein